MNYPSIVILIIIVISFIFAIIHIAKNRGANCSSCDKNCGSCLVNKNIKKTMRKIRKIKFDK